MCPNEGLLLDLSRNGGGLLPHAVTISGFFIREGEVVSIENSRGQQQMQAAASGKREGPTRARFDDGGRCSSDRQTRGANARHASSAGASEPASCSCCEPLRGPAPTRS